MTPIVKAYSSDMGFRVCESAIQCLGGYGFTREYPLEQYLRDSKILSLYEGTNGIQSMDLMGRKLIIGGGEAFKVLIVELKSFCAGNAEHPTLGEQVQAFSRVVDGLKELALQMGKAIQTDVATWAANTYPGLMCFGDAIMVWRLLDMAMVAQRKIDQGDVIDFYKGKVMQAIYFADITIPPLLGRLEAACRPNKEVVQIPEAAF